MNESPETQIVQATPEAIKTVVDGLNSFNLNKVSAQSPEWTPLEFTITDHDGKIIGGILGGIGYWNGLEIKILWVSESHRNRGYGTQLLQHMEQEAKAKGAVISMLDTFDFQAEGCYLKNGYKPIGEIDDFPKGHRRVYFSKKLA